MSSHVTIPRERTAIHRPALSRPLQAALDDDLIHAETSLLDYGCGHGDDIRRLRSKGIQSEGWDPEHRPGKLRHEADVVNLGYVLNVIERASERVEAIHSAWQLARKLLIVSARLTYEARGVALSPFGDGFMTGLGTFQKFYEQQELRDWIDATLDVSSVAAAPGIFYVFRDPESRQSHVASRYRRITTRPRVRQSDRLFDEHQQVLNPLMEFVVERGRLPHPDELEGVTAILDRFGTIKRAFSIVRRVTGSADWDRIGDERAEDLLIYLALAKFGQRARFGQLPRELQLDIRAFFATYKRACALADALLYSVGELDNVERACNGSTLGKLTRTALYVHSSALPEVPSLLRIYEGCARALVGDVEGANILKLHRAKAAISYLSYPDFQKDPHPALRNALSVDLQTFRIRYRDYSDSDNPPILHRKEEFVGADFPKRETFCRLTRQEEKWGLYKSPETIGTKLGWEETLSQAGVRLEGHRVVRVKIKETSGQPMKGSCC